VSDVSSTSRSRSAWERWAVWFSVQLCGFGDAGSVWPSVAPDPGDCERSAVRSDGAVQRPWRGPL